MSMDRVLCKHGEPCILKTGLNPGPYFHKSLYMCKRATGKCDFVQDSRLKINLCPTHSGGIVSVQMWQRNMKSIKYFCSMREAGKFCGVRHVENANKENKPVSPLSDCPVSDTCSSTQTSSQLMPLPSATKSDSPLDKSPSGERYSSNRTGMPSSESSKKSDSSCASSFYSTSASPDLHSSSDNVVASALSAHCGGNSEESDVESNKDSDNSYFDVNSGKFETESVVKASPPNSVASECHRSSPKMDAEDQEDDGSFTGPSVSQPDTHNSPHIKPSNASSYREPAIVISEDSDSDADSGSETRADEGSPGVSGSSVTSTNSDVSPSLPIKSPIASLGDSPNSDQTPPIHCEPLDLKWSRTSLSEGGATATSSHPSSSAEKRVRGVEREDGDEMRHRKMEDSKRERYAKMESSGSVRPELVQGLKKPVEGMKLVKSVGPVESASVRPVEGVKLVKPMSSARNVEVVDLVGNDTQQFKVAHQSKTVMRQYMEIQHILETQAAHLPDGGSQLRVQLAQLKQRLQHLNKAPPVLDHSQVVQLSQRNLVAQSKLLTTGAIVHLHSSLENCPTEDDLEEDPPGLTVSLMRHQRRGLAWVLWRERQTPAGGIVADEMGLGKTLLMLSLVLKQRGTYEERKEKPPSKPGLVKSPATLVVVPASLMFQWEEEARSKLGGQVSVYVYHGKRITTNPHDLVHSDIVVTTYTIVGDEGSSLPSDQSAQGASKKKKRTVNHTTLFLVHWRRVILDEAHNIKNPSSAMSQGACKLSADYRWAVTGTPIQNRLKDFYSLIKFIHLAPFDDPKIWKDTVEKKGSVGMQRLNTMVSSLVLRRTKAELGLNLAEKYVTRHDIKLSEEEMAIHNIMYTEARKVMMIWLQEKGEAVNVNQEELYSGPANTLSPDMDPIVAQLMRGATSATGRGSCVLLLLLRLRQCCCHMKLLVSGLDKSAEDKDDIDLDLRFEALALDAPPQEPVDLDNLPEIFKQECMSTKVVQVIQEIKRIVALPDSPPQKCVVVSQWTAMLDIVDFHLAIAGISYTRIDGKVTPSDRLDRVKQLNSSNKNPSVMLLSLKAGGVGLNLVGANHVFLLDMHWNPALEDQAADRCHRVGQNRDVHIHKFVCTGTIEERILRLQMEKLQLASNVMTGASQKNRSLASKLTLADLKNLFEM